MSTDNEWISIGDLMSGAVTVIIVLLAISILHYEGRFENPDAGIQTDLKPIFKVLKEDFKNDLFIELDTINYKIKLAGNSGFDIGKSNLTSNIINKMNLHKKRFKEVLENNPEYFISIEGHADVANVVSTLYDTCGCKYGCSDNISLSLARAQAMRNLLIENWENSMKERVVCIGFGSNFYDKSKSDDQNRRVEIIFTKKKISNPKL